MSDSGYLISVVTPFHNTAKELIKKGMISLQNQTIGFENIEWLITVHNSEKKYFEEVSQLTSDYKNIKVFELKTPEKTPSVPRNHCLDNATGKYIAFMDSDDSFNIGALKDIFGYLESTGAQMASFRAEIETEDRNVLKFMDVRAPYEQIEDCYVLEKNDPRRGMLLFGGNATVWSKMIRRDFIEEHNIRFNKNVTIGEDGMFCLNCYKYAEKVLILPHIVAYRYYMNHGSLAQNSVNHFHTSESIRSLTNNCVDIFEAAIDAGVDPYYVGWGLGGFLSLSLMISPNLNDDDWQYVCNKMKPYINSLPELHDDGKIYTAENAQQTMHTVRTYLLGEILERPDYFNAVLKPILEANAGTEFGKKYHFADIDSAEKFQENVPLSNYDFYKPLFTLMAKVGEHDILTKEKIICYSTVKDSYGNKIFIPLTQNFISMYKSIYLNYINQSDSSSMIMMENRIGKKHYNNDGSYYTDMISALLEEIKDIDIFNSHKREFKSGSVTSPRQLVYSEEKADFTYARLLFALADKDLSQIIASFTTDVLHTMKCFEENWKQLVKDLFIGVVSEASGLSVKTREILSTQLEPNPDRAMEIAEICRKGFENIMPKIWPDLKVIIAAGTGRFAYETKELHFYAGDIAFNNGYLMTSEAIIARAVDNNSDLYVLVDIGAYLEFIPDAGNSDTCVCYKKLEEGKVYEVVVTNTAGLYRYRTDVTVKVEKIESDKVFVKYVIKV